MEVKNLFDQESYETIMVRLQGLSINNERLWGKMTTAQMLAHCKEAYKVPLTSKKLKRQPISYLGWIFRPILYNSRPYRKGLPTANNFIIKDERDFEKEKSEMLSIVTAFHERGASAIADKVHPLFGPMTAEQWGKSMWKHLDHHLRQFGA